MATMIELTCSVCNGKFQRRKAEHDYRLKENPNYKPTCSKECLKKQNERGKTFACVQCGKEVYRRLTDIKKNESGNFFCSRACSATYTNLHRVLPPTKNKDCKCIDCGSTTSVNERMDPKKARCSTCKEERKQLTRKTRPTKDGQRSRIGPEECEMCGIALGTTVGPAARFCLDCHKIKQRQAGLTSAKTQAQTRRSKNEIAFAELCQQYFKSVECNAAIFESEQGDKWDADVIVHDHKIAVLWNGAWHHKKIKEKHSVLQVQTRDKIKQAVIRANGYTPYVIDDLGESSKEKDRKVLVEAEWKKFLEFVDGLKRAT